MSYHIHKAMGYGIKYEKPNLDSRLSFTADDSESYEDLMDDLTLEDLVVYMKLNYDSRDYEIKAMVEEVKNQKNKQKLALENYVHHIFDPDEAHGIIICPPIYNKEWYRFSDDLDYMDHTVNDRSFVTDIKFTEYGYGAYMKLMNATTGKTVNLPNGRAAFGRVYIDMDIAAGGDPVAQGLGFKDVADYEKNCVPDVPDTIRAILHLTQLLKSDDMVKDFRPMVATWWA